MASLITDEQGFPKPQYEVESGAGFEAQKGKEGATFSYIKNGHNEALGSTADADTATTIVGLAKAKKGLLTTIKDTLNLIKVKLDDTASKTDTIKVTQATLTASALYGAIDLNTTAAELRIGGAALANRRTVQVFNVSETEPVFVGFNNSVSVANGIPVWPKTSITLNLSASSGLLVYAVAAAATSVRIVES